MCGTIIIQEPKMFIYRILRQRQDKLGYGAEFLASNASEHVFILHFHTITLLNTKDIQSPAFGLLKM